MPCQGQDTEPVAGAITQMMPLLMMTHPIPLKVSFLGYEHSPDLMLLAARALTFLADVFPPACGAIIRHGAVPAFCARLLTIEYIDLAEQSLQARLGETCGGDKMAGVGSPVPLSRCRHCCCCAATAAAAPAACIPPVLPPLPGP